MKIICAWHKPEPIVIGESCPSCGSRAAIIPLIDVALCLNPECGVFGFAAGEGRPTHTICAECKATLVGAEIVAAETAGS